MDREVTWSAAGAVVGVVGLIAFLGLAEAFDASWLYVPAIICLFGALLAGEVAVWGLRGVGILAGVLTTVILVAVLVELV